MTEATSASLSPDNPTVQAAQNNEPAKEQTFQNDLHRLQFESLKEMILSRNDLVGRANAANGDRLTLEEQVRNNSTKPEIVELRDKISELIMELDKHVKPIVDEAINSASGDVNEIEEKIKETDKTLKAGLAYYKNVYGEEAASFFPKQERLKGTQLRSGSGGRRIRGFDLTVTIDGEDRTFENFSTAAKHIGVDTAELQRAFFEKAGTEDASKLPESVKFVINYTEVDDDKNETPKEAFVHAFKNEANTGTPADVSEGDEDEGSDDEMTSEPTESAETDEVDLENL